MTREQIEAWRLLLEHHEAGELCDLAERALDLEDALRLFFAEADSDERGNLWAGRETISKLCTAYSAKVKP